VTSLKTIVRTARDASAWRPQHARLLVEQLQDRPRNHSGYSDDEHRSACSAWLERAQDATGNGGIAGRYRLDSGWSSAYPETTGYIIPTFLRLAAEPSGQRFAERARRAVDFLLSIQLQNGAFPGAEIDENRTEPSIFNSAQIICGLVAWNAATGDPMALRSACRAADWLISVQDADGAWRQHLYNNVPTTYSAHASCWIAGLGAHTSNPVYLEAASRHLDWLLCHQDAETGWIRDCGFSDEDHAAGRSVTHTIAYTLWGTLMLGEILQRADAIDAALRAARGVSHRLEQSGWLPGVLDSRWQAASTYTCLTGNAQMALVWMRLFELSGDGRLLTVAVRALDLVKAAQPMRSTTPGIHGGIPGSNPIWGDYIRLALPNWAAKYFVDALLMKKRLVAPEATSSRA
jgi:hypothetical protein